MNFRASRSGIVEAGMFQKLVRFFASPDTRH